MGVVNKEVNLHTDVCTCFCVHNKIKKYIFIEYD